MSVLHFTGLLLVFSATGNTDLLRTLMKEGVDIYAMTKPRGLLALDVALEHGNYDFGAQLVHAGFSYSSPRNKRAHIRSKAHYTTMDKHVHRACVCKEGWRAIDIALRAGRLVYIL